MSTDLVSPNHFEYFFFCQSVEFFCWTFRVQTLANVVSATTHFSCCAPCSRFTQRICISSKLDDSSRHVSRAENIVLAPTVIPPPHCLVATTSACLKR